MHAYKSILHATYAASQGRSLRPLRLAPRLDAHGLQVHGVLQLAHAPGRRQQRLGRHAAAVDARAADVVPLDDGHLQALECGRTCYCCSSFLPMLSSTPPQQGTELHLGAPSIKAHLIQYTPAHQRKYSTRLPTRGERTFVLGSRGKLLAVDWQPAPNSPVHRTPLHIIDTRHSAHCIAEARSLVLQGPGGARILLHAVQRRVRPLHSR